MSKKEETKFRAKLRILLELIPNSWWESVQQKSIKGTPDILGCVRGIFVGLELKRDAGSLHPLQEYKLMQIHKAGGHAYIVTPKNHKEILERIKCLGLNDIS